MKNMITEKTKIAVSLILVLFCTQQLFGSAALQSIDSLKEIKVEIETEGDEVIEMSPVYFQHLNGTEDHTYHILRIVNEENDESLSGFEIETSPTSTDGTNGIDLDIKHGEKADQGEYKGFLFYVRSKDEQVIDKGLIPLTITVKDIKTFELESDFSFQDTTYKIRDLKQFPFLVKGLSADGDSVFVEQFCLIPPKLGETNCDLFAQSKTSKTWLKDGEISPINLDLSNANLKGAGTYHGYLKISNKSGYSEEKDFKVTVKHGVLWAIVISLIGILLGKLFNSLKYFSWRYTLYDESKSIQQLIDKLDAEQEKTDFQKDLQKLRIKIKLSASSEESNLKTALSDLKTKVIDAYISQTTLPDIQERIKSKEATIPKEIPFSLAYHVLRPFSFVLALILAIYLCMMEVYDPNPTFGAKLTDYIVLLFTGFGSLVVSERVFDSVISVVNKLLEKIS